MSSPISPSSQKSLFVGNLDTRVYRQLLHEIFSLAGQVTNCHIVFDKTTGISSGFGFVEYPDHATAQLAMEKFRGRSIYGKLLTIDWARASPKDAPSRDESAAYCLFVGNLSPDVSDLQLMTAFQQFGSCVSAKCAKDPHSNKTQGFAFVSFQQRLHAAAAMEGMNGQVLNNRPLRVEWAKGKTNAATRNAALGLPDVTTAPTTGFVASDHDNSAHNASNVDKPMLTFETISAQTSPSNITAYVAGFSVNTPEEKIRERFAKYGDIREIRIPESVKAQATETMYAFVRYHQHESAASAIFDCQKGAQVDGRTVQVHWGRESGRRPPPAVMGGGRPHAPGFVPTYHHQQTHPAPYQHSHARQPYPAQPYGRVQGAGPMYQQPHVGAQNRYRPY